jgi:hypothetical protein
LLQLTEKTSKRQIKLKSIIFRPVFLIFIPPSIF